MKQIQIETGTVGLALAYKLFGKDAIILIGDWLSPAVVSIPEADVDTFKELLEEEFVRLGYRN